MKQRRNTNKLVRIYTRINPRSHHTYRNKPTTLLCNISLAIEPHISLPVPILKSMLLPISKRTLMPRIIILPRLVSILERNRIVVPALCLNLHRIRQMARQTQRLASPVNRLLLRQPNNLFRRIIHDNIKCVVRPNAIFVALVLHDVHGAPAGCETRSWVDGLEDAEAESCGADFGNAAGVFDAVKRGLLFFAELAVFSVPGFVDEALDVEVFPVVEVFEAHDGVV
jgi:hypothetical protein